MSEPNYNTPVNGERAMGIAFMYPGTVTNAVPMALTLLWPPWGIYVLIQQYCIMPSCFTYVTNLIQGHCPHEICPSIVIFKQLKRKTSDTSSGGCINQTAGPRTGTMYAGKKMSGTSIKRMVFIYENYACALFLIYTHALPIYETRLCLRILSIHVSGQGRSSLLTGLPQGRKWNWDLDEGWTVPARENYQPCALRDAPLMQGLHTAGGTAFFPAPLSFDTGLEYCARRRLSAGYAVLHAGQPP